MIRFVSIVFIAILGIMISKYCKTEKVKNKDGTAMGVAKVRHYEALHKPSKRLYHDPYAAHMYPGSFVQTWLRESGTRWLYDIVFKGVLELLTTRTKWLDDQIMHAVTVGLPGSGYDVGSNVAANQLIILGAGYDTRGFRLDLPPSRGGGTNAIENKEFQVFEIDQPDVQTRKIQKLQNIAKTDSILASKMNSLVKFIPVDFNKDSIAGNIMAAKSDYDSKKISVVTMEGVTQYIPKSSTADTLSQLHKILAPQSILVITYVPQDIFDNPSKCGPPTLVEKLLKGTKMAGEPWISGWNPEQFQHFLEDLGYNVVSDTTVKELHDEYLMPLNRGLKDDEILSFERFVVAAVSVSKNKEQ